MYKKRSKLKYIMIQKSSNAAHLAHVHKLELIGATESETFGSRCKCSLHVCVVGQESDFLMTTTPLPRRISRLVAQCVSSKEDEEEEERRR